jgi:hypothetical protein
MKKLNPCISQVNLDADEKTCVFAKFVKPDGPWICRYHNDDAWHLCTGRVEDDFDETPKDKSLTDFKVYKKQTAAKCFYRQTSPCLKCTEGILWKHFSRLSRENQDAVCLLIDCMLKDQLVSAGHSAGEPVTPGANE